MFSDRGAAAISIRARGSEELRTPAKKGPAAEIAVEA